MTGRNDKTPLPTLSLTEAIAAILTRHPDGLTIAEIRQDGLWPKVDGVWKTWLTTRPSHDAIQQVLQRSDLKLAVCGVYDSFVNEGFWTPTELGLQVGQGVLDLLADNGPEPGVEEN